MKFSIVTAVRNGMPYIRQCVGSVRGQTGVELEHIVQDGCSSDGTTAWLHRQSDLNVKTEKDSGMYDAINRGWARAGGDIVSWLNADEQYLPGTLEKVAGYFKKNPEIDVVSGDTIITDAGGEPLAVRRETLLKKNYICNGVLNVHSCTLFFRRRLLEKEWLFFDTGYRIAGDMELILRLLEKGVRFDHMRYYASLFAVDHHNLSMNPIAEKEVAVIRQKFGGKKSGVLRKMILIGRYIEKLLSGCYRSETVSYDYAENEIPVYRRISPRKVGVFFTYKDYEKSRKSTQGI